MITAADTIREAKKQFSNRVADALLEFEGTTGIHPYGINVEMVSTTLHMGSEDQGYILGKIDVLLHL